MMFAEKTGSPIKNNNKSEFCFKVQVTNIKGIKHVGDKEEIVKQLEGIDLGKMRFMDADGNLIQE